MDLDFFEVVKILTSSFDTSLSGELGYVVGRSDTSDEDGGIVAVFVYSRREVYCVARNSIEGLHYQDEIAANSHNGVVRVKVDRKSGEGTIDETPE